MTPIAHSASINASITHSTLVLVRIQSCIIICSINHSVIHFTFSHQLVLFVHAHTRWRERDWGTTLSSDWLPLLRQGVATGMSPAGFSISVNERDLGGEPVVDLLEAVFKKAASPTHLVRDVSRTWQCCQVLLSSVDLHFQLPPSLPSLLPVGAADS